VSCSHIIHPVWWVVATSLFTLVGQNLHRLLLPTKLGSLSLSLSLSSTHCRMQHNNEWVYLCHWHFIVVWDSFGVYFFPLTWCHYFFLKPVSQTRLHLDSLLLVQQPICKLARLQLVAFVDWKFPVLGGSWVLEGTSSSCSSKTFYRVSSGLG